MFRSISAGFRGDARALVVGVFKGEKLDKYTKELDPAGHVACAAQRAECTGEVGALVQAFPPEGPERVVVVGLGDRGAFQPGVLRTAMAAVGRALAAAKIDRAEVAVHLALSTLKRPDLVRAGSAAGEGLGLIGWTCDEFRGSATTAAERVALGVRCADEDFQAGLERGLGLAASANLCRTLSQTPPNVATPGWMAQQAERLAKKYGLKCTVFRGEDLDRERFTGLKTVGQASENEPCLIRLEYTPRGAARGKPAVLVGKTMTYDSGGLSLKINNSMKGMKRDKDGGCAVFGAMHAVATVIKPRQRVVALLACAENSISDEAYRPDDVITFRNGVSVEVTNTDAEGRLVLADALCWACEKENPAYIVDMATLTGGVVVALGSVYAGLWCEDDTLRARLDAAAERSGERVWRLPHHDDYRRMMKSPIADIVNSAPVREAHPIQGAAFLSYFVEKDIPWAHIDIAGVHATERDAGPFIAGPTGYGTRLLAELLDGR
jgi:leucyl aminopeptidase